MFDGEKRPDEVDAQQREPVILGFLQESAETAADPGVGDDYVNAAVPPDDIADHRGDIGLAPRIALRRRDRGLAGRQIGDSVAHVECRDLGTFAGEQQRRRAADARPRAGHQYRLPRETSAHRVPPTISPPSTTIVWPVMYRLAGAARKAAAPAISSGSPIRPSGAARANAASAFGFSHTALAKSVRMTPGVVHGHPTMSEAVMEAARAADGWLIHG